MTEPLVGRDAWGLDPTMIFLNHGSFGACPRAVLARQAELRVQLERDPARFLLVDAPPLLDASRARLAEFVGADPNDIVFVDNATTAVNTVLASAPLDQGDEVLVTQHGYRACNNAIDVWAGKRGARRVVAHVPFPVRDEEQIVEAVVTACTRRTRLAVLDHVTSPTALVLPVQRLIAVLHERGVRVLIDGAHGPGMTPLSLRHLGADYYTGNAHKWLCAPKGSAFLFVHPSLQREVRPLVISHAASTVAAGAARFQAEFAWTGTNDPTAWICVGEAIAWGERHAPGGWAGSMRSNHDLVLQARRALCESLGVEAPCPESMLGAMAAIPLPTGIGPAPVAGAEPDPLQQSLRERDSIDVPIIPWGAHPARLVRISAQQYNRLGDYEDLARALASRRGSERPPLGSDGHSAPCAG